jgi:hypothetical protein
MGKSFYFLHVNVWTQCGSGESELGRMFMEKRERREGKALPEICFRFSINSF